MFNLYIYLLLVIGNTTGMAHLKRENSFYPHWRWKHRVFFKHLYSCTEESGNTQKREQRNECRENNRCNRYGQHWKKGSVYKETNENCALLRYYAAFSGSSLPTFRNKPSVPSSRVKKSKKKASFLDSLIYFTAESLNHEKEANIRVLG